MTTTRTLVDIPSEEKGSNDQLIESSGDLFNIVFDIKHCIFKAGNDTKLLFSIFDDTEKRMVTEEYCLHLSANNFPTVGSPEGAFTRFILTTAICICLTLCALLDAQTARCGVSLSSPPLLESPKVTAWSFAGALQGDSR